MPTAPHLPRTQIGVNADGTAHYSYTYSGAEGGGVVVTGNKVAGVITLADGTQYDLTPDMVAHHPGHLGPILHHIELRHEEAGTMGPGFTHICGDHCGGDAIFERRQ